MCSSTYVALYLSNLFLGKKHRKVRVHNSDKNQAWLQQHLDIMHQAYQSTKACVQAQPHHRKCQTCIVQNHCDDKILSKTGSPRYKV